MDNIKIKVGITHGDINGIGYEVIFKSLLDSRIFDLFTPIVYGSSKIAAYHRKTLKIDNINLNSIQSAEEAHDKRVNIINCTDDEIKVELGKLSKDAGKAALQALDIAVEDLKNEKIDILVTAPISKEAIQSDDFKFPGHTEYLESKLGDEKALMLLISNNLRVGVVAGHVAVADIPKHITKKNINDKIEILHNSLVRDFGILKPKIAVLSLNPHCGDNGLLGTEEIEIINPCLKELREKGIMAMGPYAADGLFGSGDYTKFDAILAMYHDQGLAPFKALAFDSGVNYTAGLSKIRTSPAHGTAFAIAGKNIASKDSFLEAVYLAIDIYRRRNIHDKVSARPLKNHKIDLKA